MARDLILEKYRLTINKTKFSNDRYHATLMPFHWGLPDTEKRGLGFRQLNSVLLRRIFFFSTK